MSRIVLGVSALCLVACGAAAGQSRSYEVRGGAWWSEGAFVEGTMYSVDGLLTRSRPPRVDSVIDLDGAYVVPPFAEAHTHTIAYVRSRIDEFVSTGVFYAMVMNVDLSAIEQNAFWFEGPSTVDLAYTTVAATASDAHPIQIGTRNGRTVQEVDGDWVTVIESRADLDAKWPAMRDANPDFIKLFLLHSDRYAERRGDATVQTRYRGMDPELVPPLVARAQDAGLRVAAHVRSAYDFRVAVAAGVDIVAHLPGFSMGPFNADALDDPDRAEEARHPEWFTVGEADARAAAARGAVVITTVGGVGRVPAGLRGVRAEALGDALAARRRVVAHNLRLLRDAGVRIAIGSDAGEGSPVAEALGVDEFGVFSPAELLVMLTEHAARVTFPDRRVGRVEEGYEASFVALGGNPLESLEHLRSVRFLFKDGRPLEGGAVR